MFTFSTLMYSFPSMLFFWSLYLLIMSLIVCIYLKTFSISKVSNVFLITFVILLMRYEAFYIESSPYMIFLFFFLFSLNCLLMSLNVVMFSFSFLISSSIFSIDFLSNLLMLNYYQSNFSRLSLKDL